MAEALVSKVVVELGSLAAPQIHHEFSLVRGVQQKVVNLRSTFEAIHGVLADAEKQQITNKSVRLWLDKLIQVSYEMDAVFDEWNTAITLRSNLKLFDKVFFYSHSCFHSNEVHRLGLGHRIAWKIEKLNKKLTDLSIEKERYTFSTQNVNVQFERQTTSYVDVSEVYGRDEEKDVIVRELLSESSQVGRGYDIISVVGSGGIGKTTLAQLVYNDKNVDARFDLKIWVCVSDPFDVTTVARAILEALRASNAHQLVKLEALANQIKELLRGKKFFLVLDDVWTEEYRKWEALEGCLKDGAIGSKILVTTRKEEVAKMMGVKSHKIINLQLLSEEFCWSIFHRVAFFNKEDNKELEGIGQQIAQKCKGLPLVAKTLGSLMRFKEYTSEEWMKVLKSELWELGDQVKDEVFVPLLLSYYDLSPLEKRCFLYCSYFLKDHEINRDELIQLWLSQGFLSNKKDYEGEGVNCFKNLVSRSLFQDFEKDDDGNIIGCKMHDIVHDFVMFLTESECINTLINSKGERMDLENMKAFHCTVGLKSEKAQIPKSIYNNKTLRTLSVRNLGSQITTKIGWDLLKSLTCLRTLSLHDCGLTRLPKNIVKLIHLRYLSIREPYEHFKLPKTIGNLVNLQTLDVRDSVRALPKSIGKLVNLRHLYLGGVNVPQMITLPKEVGKLNSLETLDCGSIMISVESNASSVLTLEDLSKLNRLKGCLRIFITEVKDVEEAERAQALRNKEGLVELSLDLFGTRTLESRSTTEVLLEGLEPPHQKLKHLEIRKYYGITLFPSWMTKLVNLKTLKLTDCPNCEVLGAFGKLTSLESLTIELMTRVKRVGVEFLGIDQERGNNKMDLDCYRIDPFPKLKQLHFSELTRWEEWRGSDDDSCCFTIMPSLVSLTFESCENLKAPLPAFLQKTPLQDLTFWDCPYLERHDEEGMKTEDRIKILTDMSLRELS